MVPWLETYTVDMSELYTELKLEGIDNKPSGPKYTQIDDYKEIFDRENGNTRNDTAECQQPKKKARISKHKGKKVLIEGKPGMG